jgi:hypothetical protein
LKYELYNVIKKKNQLWTGAKGHVQQIYIVNMWLCTVLLSVLLKKKIYNDDKIYKKK